MLENKFPLFIFEMANNHFGDVNHGKKIIEEFGKVKDKFSFNFAIKFQYRNLDTFIHPSYKERNDIKYVKRFSETRLADEEFKELVDFAKSKGFITICTPFDEVSVDKIIKHEIDIIKIASCSFTDWPLLEKIVLTDKPLIASTAGSKLEDIDKVVSFFEHREKEFCIMHCVGAYPTERDKLELNQIDLLKKKYPEVNIGFSTHEEPDNIDSIKIAIAKGAKIFERHVGLKEPYGINGYSSVPDQIEKWLKSASEAFEMCGVTDRRYEITEKEFNDLHGLKRGVFVKSDLKKGEKLSLENTFFAIPNIENQIVANDFSKYKEFTLNKDIKANEPVLFQNVEIKDLREKVLKIILQLKELILKSGLKLPNKIDLELSHHYGIDKFDEIGASILNFINREYCKKIIILLPGQSHPEHRHSKKEETFHILYGEMDILKGNKELKLKEGDLITIERNELHSFKTDMGVIFEEISTTHYLNDSFYEDEVINNNKDRKTKLTFWSDWLIGEIS